MAKHRVPVGRWSTWCWTETTYLTFIEMLNAHSSEVSTITFVDIMKYKMQNLVENYNLAHKNQYFV